jgi:hypothetical protein
VTGKSGRFSEQVICHFPKESRLKMAVGDQIIIRSEGIGMVLTDYPDVVLKGIAPNLLNLLPVHTGTSVDFGVVAKIPAHLIGAGLGLTSEGGSLHMQSTDRAELAAHGLDTLRLGDLVALEDTDSRFNHGYLRGALAIGVVGATDGPRAGYGPGITVLMTAPAGQLGLLHRRQGQHRRPDADRGLAHDRPPHPDDQRHPRQPAELHGGRLCHPRPPP